MSKITIIYEWQFSVCVINRKGKKYKSHQETVLGYNYDMAKFTLFSVIKKRKCTMLHINGAKVIRIAFAYYCTEGYPWVPHKEYHKLPFPEIPDIL